MKCPYCQIIIDDDSRYCDQCGTHLMYCPSCGQAKKGSSCPRCGELLVSAEQYFSGSSAAKSPDIQPVASMPKMQTMRLEGEGLILELKEGEFGRKCSLFPELSRFPTVSSKHGRISKMGIFGWLIMDLGSTNGTYINGQRLDPQKQYELKSGMTLKIATLTFTVR